jgi:hypothetical protein
MDPVGEILTFSAEFLNFPAARSAERKRKIRNVLLQMTGQRVDQSCGSCYVEALLRILNHIKMSKFETRRGYVAQFDVAFNGVKSFTNRNLEIDPKTYDPIAEEYLKRYPGRAVYFVHLPGVVQKEVPKNIQIVTPQFMPPSPPEKLSESTIERPIEAIVDKQVNKPVNRPKGKNAKKK